MARARYSPEQIVAKLREAEAVLADGGTVEQVCRRIGVKEPTYRRWRRDYGGLAGAQAQGQDPPERAGRRGAGFLPAMGHDLRNPLNAILGYLELILDDMRDEVSQPVREILEQVDTSGRQLSRLINDVIDFAKIEAGALELSMEEYSLEGVIHNVATGLRSQAEAKGLAFQVEVPDDLPTGHGDEQRITQALLNIAGNAIGRSGAGPVALRVSMTAGDFLVSVSDAAPGIAPEEQERMFSGFFPAVSAGTGSTGGSGLGLAIANGIVALHGGRIRVESRSGDGSTFYLTLPRDGGEPGQ